MQANTITSESILVATVAGIISYFEISLSRSYKILKSSNMQNGSASTLERYLKIISFGTLLTAVLALALRLVLG
jgi:Na+/alanine symporter